MTGTNYTGRCIRPMLKPLSFESEQITKELEMDMTPTKFKEGDCLSDEIDLLTVLDSTGRNNSYSRMFISSTPAGTCAKPTTPKSKRSVLNVLDQLCSPISMETSEEWHLESSIKEKVMLCSTNDTSLLSKSVLNEHKNTMNSNSLDKSLEDNDKDNLSVTHNHLFDDISDTSLQLICEATNNVVDNPKSISNNRKNISNYEVTMSTGDYKSPEGENASVLSNVNSSLKMTSNFEDAKTGSIYPDTFHNRKLIYSNQNFISGVQSLVNLSDLFSEVKCLEEANRIFKKDFKTGDLQFLKGQETPILGISKPKENVQPLKNIVSIQTSSEFEDKSKSLNDSLGITDTQFCEAIEAAELISNLDTSCNVNTYSTKHKSQSGGSLKLYSSSLKKTEKLSSDEIHSTEFITGFEDFHSSNSTCFEIAQKLVVSSPDCEQSLSNTKNLFLPTDKTPEIIHIQNIKPIIEYDKIKIGSKNLDDTSFIHSKKDLIQNNDVEESTKIEFHTSHEFEPILKGFQPAKGKYLKISEDSLKNESLKLIHKEFIVPREKLFQKSDVSIEKDNIEPTIRQNKFDTTCQKSIKLKETRETTKHLPIGRSKVNHKGFLTESDKSSESLDKTRKVFDNELHLSYKGFQTASGKTVEISEKSLKHAKQLFSEEPNLIQSKEEVMNSFEQINQILDGQPSLKCKGFSTTSVNSIKVSDVTLEKAKKLLDDVPNFIQEFLPTENEKSHEFSVDSSKNSKQSFDSQLCIIESRKSVQISADSIERGQKLFDNERIISHKGFQTASGKTVKISEKSLNHAKQLFSEEPNLIQSYQQKLQKEQALNSFEQIEQLLDDHQNLKSKGFSTSSVKSIKVSDESLEKSKKLPDDVPIHEFFPTVNEKSLEFSVESSKNNKESFDSQLCIIESGKAVQISADSFERGQTLLDNERIIPHKGFQTASGKTVKISEKSLNHAKQLFSEEPNLIQSYQQKLQKEQALNSFEQIEQLLDGHQNLKSKGFSKSSVKSIKVSDESLEKAKKLLDDVPIHEFFPTVNEKSLEFSVESSKNNKESFDSQLCIIESGKSERISADSFERGQKLLDNERIISHKGFQTASGKTVKISEKSLNHAKQLFSEEPNLIQSYQQKLQKEQALNSFEQIEQLLDGHQNIKSKGFSTSSVKSIKVSDESLEKAKKLLDDVPIHEFFPTVNEKSLEFSVESSKNNRESFGSQLCTIESGKSEQISADSFERGRNLLGNERIISHKGFQTASGKTVEISEKSLKQAEQLFYEEPNSLQRDQQKIHQKLDEETKKSLGQVSPQFKVQPSLKYKGFLTASGKLVQISEESLKIANKLLDDESKDNRKSIDVSDKSFKQPKKMCDELSNIVQKGFQTAKEKRVKISEDSLAKAKQFFDDEFYSVQNSYQIINQKSLNIPEKPSEQARLVLNGKLNLIPNGLLTVNQKLVKISDRSMNKANELFDDEQKIVQRDFESLTEKTVKDSEKLLEHKGFITASGKSVEILDESLEGARRYLVDESNTMQHVFQTANQNSKVTCRGLRPVHAESVKTPEEILKKTETLMKNIAYEPDAPLQGYRIDGNLSEFTYECSKSTKNYFSANYETSLFPKGFQTASGKSVKICEEALKKAKSLLDFTGLESTPSQTLTDFKISNQSTERVSSNEKRLLNESYEAEYVLKGFTKFHTERNISEKPTKKSVIVQDHSGSKTKVAFQTASGKNVHISEETLRKTKDLFNDDFNENEPTEFKKSINKSSELNQHETKYMKTNMYTLNNLSSTNQFVSSQSFEKSRLDKTKSNISTHIIENNDTEHNDSANLKKYDLHRKTDYYYKEQKRKRDHSVLEESTFDKLKLNEPSLKNLDKTNSHVRRKRRKLFIETDQINDHRLVCDEGGSFKPIGTSVISEADLSLLNQSRINHSGNENLIKENCTPFKMSPSTAREISESMAALLEDEASNSPFSLKPYVSSPSMINDRHVGLPSINCFENEIHFNNKPLSPILGSHSLFKNKSIGGISTPGKLASNIDKTQSSGFKPPYSTSTPNESQLQSKRKLLFSNLYSNAEKRQKTDQSSENVTTMDVVTLRLEAALKQEQYVKEKLKGKEKPCQGSYLLRKQTEKSLILRDLINGPLRMYSTHQLNQYGVKKSVQDISIRNVSYFKFAISDYYSKEIVSSNINGIPIGDGALLILDGEGKAGVKEIARAFLASPSVDPSLISAEWIENHFKWIVLKMSAMEKMFPRELGGRYLTPNSLMLQLKYRYDREIDRNQRPALRKILERDETAAKTMVLYVADIFHAENQSDNEKQMGRQEIELSDSWYSVKASIDYEMEALIRSKKVKVGTKLMITGADLINNDAGCHPLETPANVRLRISTNSCRRARWYTRLGFHSKSPWPTRLNTVLGRGGALPALTAFVARTYPILFLEKVNGRTVIRGVRAEQAAADEHQTKRQQCAETIYAKLQQDLDKSKSTNKNPNIRTAVKTATNTKQLYSLLDGVEDISFLQDILTKEQINEIRQLKEEETKKTQQQLQDRLVEELNKKVPPRNVTRMLKVRLVDEDDSCSALLTIWNPSDDIVSCVSEGNCLTFFNISASGFSRFGDLQLTAGKQTKYSLQKHCSIARRITALSELQNSEFKPQFSEVDVVGLVVQSSEFDKSSSLVYLADSSNNLLGISFWTDLKTTGYANTLTPGALVAVSNLHWRSNVVSWKLPSAYVTEMSTFSQHPRQSHLQEALAQLRLQLQAKDLAKYLENCQERIQSLVAQRNSGGLQLDSTPLGKTTEPTCLVGCSGNGNDKLFRDTNLSVNGSTDTPTIRRLEMLERYGEPPPITVLPASTPTSVKRSFRPPLRKLTDK